uniref:Uncharacterized protein n=1 Tax=Solanum tuberosum TaxID=4113 RepID=M1DM87_SOLTU
MSSPLGPKASSRRLSRSLVHTTSRDGAREDEATPIQICLASLETNVLSPERTDEISGEKEQLAYRREVPQSCTMSPNDPKHDDVEG